MTEAEVAAAIQLEHAFRVRNDGDGDWLVSWFRGDGRRIEAVYDHPVYGDSSRVRVVTILRERRSGGG